MGTSVDEPAFEPFSDPTRGRGLRASRDIRAGEIVLRESAAAIVLGSGDDVVHRMLSSILLADTQSQVAISALVGHKERFDPSLLIEVARTATPAVRSLVEMQCGREAAAAITEAAVVNAYCKHCINSMSILDPESLVGVGMGLYPQHGALLNHSHDANCWTFFEEETHVLALRALAPIARGSELTIAYLDVATPRAQLRERLRSRYFFDPAAEPAAAEPAAAEAQLRETRDALVGVERLGREHGYSFLHAHGWCDDGVDDPATAVEQAISRCSSRCAKRGKAASEDSEDDDNGGGGDDDDEVASLLRGLAAWSPAVAAPVEPCLLIPPLTRALEATGRRGEWAARLAVTRCLLQLYPSYYRVTHPRMRIRSRTLPGWFPPTPAPLPTDRSSPCCVYGSVWRAAPGRHAGSAQGGDERGRGRRRARRRGRRRGRRHRAGGPERACPRVGPQPWAQGGSHPERHAWAGTRADARRRRECAAGRGIDGDARREGAYWSGWSGNEGGWEFGGAGRVHSRHGERTGRGGCAWGCACAECGLCKANAPEEAEGPAQSQGGSCAHGGRRRGGGGGGGSGSGGRGR